MRGPWMATPNGSLQLGVVNKLNFLIKRDENWTNFATHNPFITLAFTAMLQPQVPDSDTEKGGTGLEPEQVIQLDESEDNSQVPKLSYLALFWKFFFQFGCQAWGSTVAQIALIQEILVVKEKWITVPRFKRVFAVYQLVPGPEAAELCMYFGCLSRGRIGGLLAGLGFMLPGLILMLIASYGYAKIGFGNIYVNASFRALQPIVAAMVYLLLLLLSRGPSRGCTF